MRRWGLEGVVDEDAAVMVAMFCALLSALSEKKMNKNESQFLFCTLTSTEHSLELSADPLSNSLQLID